MWRVSEAGEFRFPGDIPAQFDFLMSDLLIRGFNSRLNSKNNEMQSRGRNGSPLLFVISDSCRKWRDSCGASPSRINISLGHIWCCVRCPVDISLGPLWNMASILGSMYFRNCVIEFRGRNSSLRIVVVTEMTSRLPWHVRLRDRHCIECDLLLSSPVAVGGATEYSYSNSLVGI